jgi:hypothetical protein
MLRSRFILHIAASSTLALFVFLSEIPAEAKGRDLVVMKNGDQLSGEVKKNFKTVCFTLIPRMFLVRSNSTGCRLRQ